MKLITKVENVSEALELLIIVIVIITITISVTKIFILYFLNINKSLDNEFTDIDILKTFLLKQISFVLTLIWTAEILKIIFIKTYKQLIIAVTVGLLKIILEYYLDLQIRNNVKNKHYYKNKNFYKN